jgi:hypothetical protein
MGGFIILNDGRAWAAANWAYDEAIRSIVEALPPTDDALALSGWLLGQTCEVRGSGLGSVDLRELTAENQALFSEAVRKATARIKPHGGWGWSDPSLFLAWKDRFDVLLKLIESIEKGEPASTLNPHMTAVIPPTGERAGPGRGEQEPA